MDNKGFSYSEKIIYFLTQIRYLIKKKNLE